MAVVKNFDELHAELAQKAQQRPEGSGTVQALDAGVHHIGKKIIEEAGEVWIAAEYMMVARGLNPNDIYRYL